MREPAAPGVNHWARYHEHWQRLRPPLRPSAEVVAAFDELTLGRSPCALLGVTPELAGLTLDLTALDRDPNMIAAVWPGDRLRRRALRADWLHFPAALNQLAAVVGDGSLNVLPDALAHQNLLRELLRVLAPNGRAVLRVFLRPSESAPPSDRGNVDEVVEAAALSQSFHGFKWRLAMALCAERQTMSLPVRDLLAAFRDRVVRGSAERWMLDRGWDAADLTSIEVYAESTETYSFPTRAELETSVPDGLWLRWHDVLGYELAERCPLAVLDKL